MCVKLGFDSRWINLVMNCVTFVSYSILLNGQPTESFSPQRGPFVALSIYYMRRSFLFTFKAGEIESLYFRNQDSKAVPNHIPPFLHGRQHPFFFKANQTEVEKVKGIILT